MSVEISYTGNDNEIDNEYFLATCAIYRAIDTASEDSEIGKFTQNGGIIILDGGPMHYHCKHKNELANRIYFEMNSNKRHISKITFNDDMQITVYMQSYKKDAPNVFYRYA